MPQSSTRLRMCSQPCPSIWPHKRTDGWPIWQVGVGAPHVMAPHLHTTSGCDPILPLRHVAWQPLHSSGSSWSRQLQPAAGLPDHAQALVQAGALCDLAEKGRVDSSQAVPDGLVPARLPLLLRAMGVRGDDVRPTITGLIEVQCKGGCNLERAAAHRDAVHPHELGVLLPGVHHHTVETFPCHLCGADSTRLQSVGTGLWQDLAGNQVGFGSTYSARGASSQPTAGSGSGTHTGSTQADVQQRGDITLLCLRLTSTG